MKTSSYQGFDSLPAVYAEFFEQAGAQEFFYSQVWLKHLAGAIFDMPELLWIYAVEDSASGAPILVMPGLCAADPALPGARVLRALSHHENFVPLCLLFDARAGNPLGALTYFFRELKSTSNGLDGVPFDALRLWPVVPESEFAVALHTALRRAGFWVQTYANSYNRFEKTKGLSYETYFAARSANHRHDVRRRMRKLEKSCKVRFDIYKTTDGLERGIADYTSVAEASWKEPGTMVADSLVEFIRIAAHADILRLGILSLDGRPVAAQFWLISGDVGHSVRAAYDEAYKKEGVGAILTNHMIRHVIDEDGVAEINYGYGGENYKEKWMKDDRYLCGYMAFNPRTRRGLYFAVRHILGHFAKAAVVKPLMHFLRIRRANP